ncbi:hypothetical protein EHI8A_220650 [Entamoeba histolytica HM-1:IMSS-B]|uniref:Uncharacterized protein n=6 Tax=Entamoeba histolytica TaxID=5759 RepID=C4LZH0_ENTH1|nr:hypothetical protein EHI_124310 [Entamoeba histolytica HM-1:IMSS]EMD45291.1 Hypothetical protein EHI5A_222100 [Entamoeba histolytica KU27]EMH75901.1 hypothetical protein EHI8A_220650 [Entamoeba histolytica HM-1:IMSS-B]ENY60844.1 hypothetical protein EHI7A_189090 [Entamoeba histolytica HM-1:IMSS-A]GAT94261.1 hypothetical protein CL6EHI_124310 [Entamoeba histolytica]EAL49473.2 hypothetical protein EHI_124310 [Entamoeba histolytica HM-1:IMSS]|eukprot:XP_654859.2 hypothetical protein EHI_124310 [Entamoeba histolytica HM-1:IMSS]
MNNLDVYFITDDDDESLETNPEEESNKEEIKKEETNNKEETKKEETNEGCKDQGDGDSCVTERSQSPIISCMKDEPNDVSDIEEDVTSDDEGNVYWQIISDEVLEESWKSAMEEISPSVLSYITGSYKKPSPIKKEFSNSIDEKKYLSFMKFQDYCKYLDQSPADPNEFTEEKMRVSMCITENEKYIKRKKEERKQELLSQYTQWINENQKDVVGLTGWKIFESRKYKSEPKYSEYKRYLNYTFLNDKRSSEFKKITCIGGMDKTISSPNVNLNTVSFNNQHVITSIPKTNTVITTNNSVIHKEPNPSTFTYSVPPPIPKTNPILTTTIPSFQPQPTTTSFQNKITSVPKPETVYSTTTLQPQVAPPPPPPASHSNANNSKFSKELRSISQLTQEQANALAEQFTNSIPGVDPMYYFQIFKLFFKKYINSYEPLLNMLKEMNSEHLLNEKYSGIIQEVLKKGPSLDQVASLVKKEVNLNNRLKKESSGGKSFIDDLKSMGIKRQKASMVRALNPPSQEIKEKYRQIVDELLKIPNFLERFSLDDVADTFRPLFQYNVDSPQLIIDFFKGLLASHKKIVQLGSTELKQKVESCNGNITNIKEITDSFLGKFEE